jgi:putative transcriptional regulator
MDKSTNHPYDELLAAYSAGSLPLSQALCISAHLEHCSSCGQKLQQLNHVGSELMQQLKPSKVSDELKTIRRSARRKIPQD